MFIELSTNWVSADVSTLTLFFCRWSDMRGTLENLMLTDSRLRDNVAAADVFFDTENIAFHGPLHLRSFAAFRLSKSCISRFLTPCLTYFKLMHGNETVITQTLEEIISYLYQVPNLSVLNLENVTYSVQSLPERPALLTKLTDLKLSYVLYHSMVLCEITAPSSIAGTFRIQHSEVILALSRLVLSRTQINEPTLLAMEPGLLSPS